MKKSLILVSLCFMSVICFGKQKETSKEVVTAAPIERMHPKFSLLEEKAYGEIEEYTIYFLTQPEGFKNLGKELFIKGRFEEDNANKLTSESKVWVFIHHHPSCPCPNSCPCQKDKETR